MVISELFRTELLDIREKVYIFILHEGVEQFVSLSLSMKLRSPMATQSVAKGEYSSPA